MPYVITDGPNGRVWWDAAATLPPEYPYIRDATLPEAALMDRILAADGRRDTKAMDRAAAKLGPLMEH